MKKEMKNKTTPIVLIAMVRDFDSLTGAKILAERFEFSSEPRKVNEHVRDSFLIWTNASEKAAEAYLKICLHPIRDVVESDFEAVKEIDLIYNLGGCYFQPTFESLRKDLKNKTKFLMGAYAYEEKGFKDSMKTSNALVGIASSTTRAVCEELGINISEYPLVEHLADAIDDGFWKEANLKSSFNNLHNEYEKVARERDELKNANLANQQGPHRSFHQDQPMTYGNGRNGNVWPVSSFQLGRKGI